MLVMLAGNVSPLQTPEFWVAVAFFGFMGLLVYYGVPRLIGKAVEVARLGDVPVLAELAGEIAARRAERQDGSARKKMVERLLFDRIDTEAR